MQKREASGFGQAEVGGVLLEAVLSITPGCTSLQNALEQNFTIPDLKLTDRIVAVNLTTQAETMGVVDGPGRVTSAGQIAILFSNVTATSVAPAAGLHSVLVYRRT